MLADEITCDQTGCRESRLIGYRLSKSGVKNCFLLLIRTLSATDSAHYTYNLSAVVSRVLLTLPLVSLRPGKRNANR